MNTAVDRLIEDIVKKLQANRELLQKSLSHGRLVWRVDRKKEKTEIDLELKF